MLLPMQLQLFATLPLLLLAAAAAAAPVAPTAPVSAVSDGELHQRAIVIDTHSDCTARITYEGADFVKGSAELSVDLPKMRSGGLDAQFFSIFVGPWMKGEGGYYGEALRQFEAVHKMLRLAPPKELAWARTAAELRANAKRGVTSALFGVEGGHALLPGSEKEQLEHLRKFHELGARYLTLSWSIASPIGGSSGDDSDGQGLTDFGRQVVNEMNRLGMLVDVSHVSDPLFWDVIRYVKKPVIASHSSARALTNVPRNLSDAMVKAVARNGGAVCVNYNPAFLDESFYNSEKVLFAEAQRRKLAPREAWKFLKTEAARLPQVPLSRLLDHIDHLVKVAGAEHVCLGSDFDGITATPTGLSDASMLPRLTAELRKRGHSAAEVQKILGENLLRVMEANEPAAGR